ncbi:hypothetical protein C7T94_14405 [Pedobacter yulinensis]|uniref:DoxX family protein n=1 Tax=Pedobacter yulinensis TaxID=2126353 RepID=A0A2T3HN62_9SPHI|nr:hypothetical protein [Pedobacter yulinensis]PST83884.1 hypothetical protein C7T94_14405 [Pedobacter yulinensis]
MSLHRRLDHLHALAQANRWLKYFTVFTRVALALGFLPSGFVKIAGERFTSLSVNHPMGHYLEALHLTGYYYTAIGIFQVGAAVLLLIPRTATLGAVLYFPIILNICVLSLAVRFEGSLISSPLMVLANLYLLIWDYDKLKYLIIGRGQTYQPPGRKLKVDNRFPFRFFAAAFTVVALLVLLLTQGFDIMPRNTLGDCGRQCDERKDPRACYRFCDCIHRQGQPLDTCLAEYRQALMRAKHLKPGKARP